MSLRTRIAVLVTAVLVAGACSVEGGQTARSPQPAEQTTTSVDPGDPGNPGNPDEPTPDQSPEVAGVAWEPCHGDLECGDLEVPLDYDHPDGATITIAVAKRPAADADARLGTLMVNPGGPGGSAIELVQYISLPAAITDRFDVVGFDPRGVGESSPLDCRTHLQAIYDADPTMEDEADRDHFLEVSQDFVDECEDAHGDVLPHLGTVNVAHDMDQVRRALGDDRVNYVGFSYGTSIGQQYARLYPDKVRTMVLDGVVDQTQTGVEGARGQAEGFQDALNAFTSDCDATDCGLEPSAGAVIDQVTAAAERRPIPSRSDRPATPGVVNVGLARALYAKFLWPSLVDALREAQDGDGTGLVRLADEYLGRNPDGTYANGFEIYFAVSCIDSEWPSDPNDLFAAAEEAGRDFPRVGEGLLNDYVRCSLWPVEPDPVIPISNDLEGLPPVLVISTTGDPATPYVSGVNVAKQIPGAVLITNEGEGHTIFGQGKACVDDAVTDYLIDEEVPSDDVVCS